MKAGGRSPVCFVMLLAGLALAGCGGESEGRVDQGETNESEETRTVEHAFGVTEVPKNPRKVVSLNSFGTLDELLALGVKPVGSAALPGEEPFAKWLEGQTGGIEPIGTTASYEPNLEQIAALEPDLIIGPEFNVESIYDDLSRIAPTVAVPEDPDNPYNYEADLRFVAETVGREEKSERLLADYEERLEEFRDAMDDRLGDTEVSVIRYFEDGEVEIPGYEGYVGTLLQDAGVRRPPGQRIEKALIVNFERTDLMDGDVIFAYGICNQTLEDASSKTRRSLQSSPLWQRLDAVRNDRVYEVDACLWAGSGIQWADEIIDDLNEYLVEDRARVEEQE